MEGQHKSGDNKFNAKKAEIAAAGNRPEDWKTYIDETKLNMKDLPLDDKRKSNIISYMYHSAFQAIPVSNTSLAHALLLVDYATFKSDQSLEDAEKLMFHGRRYLRMHAVIHVASAELELKKGNRDRASLILKRSTHFGAKPEHVIREAKDRLARKCTKLLHTDSKENESLDYSSGHNSSSSSGVETTGETSQPCLRQTEHGHDRDGYGSQWPSCKSSTEELQQGLDLISHSHRLTCSTSTPSLFASTAHPKTKIKGATLGPQSQTDSLDTHMPDPPSLLSHPFQNLANNNVTGPRSRHNSNTMGDSSMRSLDLGCKDYFHAQAQGNANVVEGGKSEDFSSLNKTPQVSSHNPSLPSHAKKEDGQESALKLHRWHSASAIQRSGKWSSSASYNKVKLLNLPPQRVRADQYMSDESEEEEKCDSKSSTSTHKGNTGSSSLTFGTGRCQRSLFDIPSLGTSADFNGASSHRNASLSAVNNPSLETKSTSDRSQNGTYNVQPGTGGRSNFTEEKKTSCESVHSQLSSEQYQQRLPPAREARGAFHSQDGELYRNLRPIEASKPSLHGVDRIEVCPPETPVSMSGKSQHELPFMKTPQQSSLPHDMNPPRSTRPVVEPNQLSLGCPPGGGQAAILKSQEPQKMDAVAGGTYSVPGQSQNQGVPANFITPAKQTGLVCQGGKKIICVKGKPYPVIKLLGRGGSAKVYQVQDPETLNMKALKCVNLSCVSREVLEGYKNEIALLEKLQHCDRVIKLYSSEYVESQKKLLVLMECGETNLADFIAQNARNKDELHSVTICYLWGHMVKAVQAMHHEGVIHSDLKPANFLLVSGTIKLIDFGIANSLQQDKTSVIKSHVMGTPNYMSPEALMASNGDPSEAKPRYKVGTRSDVWSLGCILYQMVYGHTPFQHVRLKLEAIVNPAHEIQFPPIDDAALMDILKKCLTRDVKRRPTTDDLMNHPYLTKQKLAKPSNPVKRVAMVEDDMSSASPRTLRQYYLKKAEEFQSMASSLVTKMQVNDANAQ